MYCIWLRITMMWGRYSILYQTWLIHIWYWRQYWCDLNDYCIVYLIRLKNQFIQFIVTQQSARNGKIFIITSSFRLIVCFSDQVMDLEIYMWRTSTPYFNTSPFLMLLAIVRHLVSSRSISVKIYSIVQASCSSSSHILITSISLNSYCKWVC